MSRHDHPPLLRGDAPAVAASPEESALTADVFEALDLSPEQFLTDSGLVNRGKLRAALWYPHDYLPEGHWMRAADEGRLRAENARLAREAHAWWTAARDATVAERERWERALKQTWQAIDPLKPAGQPGSYARGYDNGFAAALEVLRGNLGPNVRAKPPMTAAQEHEDE